MGFEAFMGARHRYRGAADYVGGTNSSDLWLRAGMKVPKQKITILTDYHLFHLQNPEGTWFDFKGSPMGETPVGNDDSLLGHEVDLIASWKPHKIFNFRLGHALFVPKGAGEEIAGPDPSGFTYLWMTATH